MSILPQRGQDEEATTYLDRILPELNEILENSLSGTAFVEGGKVYVKIASPYNAADKDLELGKMLTNASNIVTIDTEKLEDAAVTLAKVANGSISGDKLVTSEAVITQSAQIGDGTILTAAIGDAQITNAKIGSLDANKITSGTIAADRFGANSITAGKIAADTITSTEIAANAITASEIASDAVTSAKIAADAVTTNKLAANSITSAKLATSSLITQSAQIDDGIITNAKINSLNADKISGGSISASFLSGGTLTIGSGGIQTIVGQFNPENLNAGVILQVLANSVARGSAENQSPITIPNTTFTSTNNSSFNTDAVVILIANASCQSSGQGTTIATRFMTGSSALALSPSASATGAGNADVRIHAAKVQLNKNQQYFASISYNNAGQGEAGQGTGSVVILEVRRV